MVIRRRSARARSRLLGAEVFGKMFGTLAALATLVTPAMPAMAAALENPFEELAAIEEARLEAAGGRADAVSPLLGMMELAESLPPGRFDVTLRRLIDRPGADPLVAARVRDWLARRAEDDGQEAAGATLRAPLGLLSRFWVVGPFGDGRASLGVEFSPESEIGVPDGSRRYLGKERSVGWRHADGAIRRGALVLGAVVRPDTQTAAYALAFVRADRPTDAALRLGTPGPVKVWCNGKVVHSADRIHAARLDQDAVGIKLGVGWNRLLIKTVVTEGAWQLFARLTTPDGRPLVLPNEWEPTEDHAGASGSFGSSRVAPRATRIEVRSLDSVLRQRVRTAPSPQAAAVAGLDLGRYLLMVEPGDRDEKLAAAAFEASVARHASLEALMGLANAGREEDESRRAFARALDVAHRPRDRARVLSALGDIARNQHRDALAVERWRAALAADARWWPAAVSLAGEEESAGFPGAASARVQGLPAEVQSVPSVARERARLAMALDRRTEAEGIWRALLAHAHDDVDLLRELANAARERGDSSELSALLRRAALLRPEMPSLTVDWARALEGTGDRAGARAVLEAGARRLPDDPTWAAELGRLLDRIGERAQALAWLRTALELRPQDPPLRRYYAGLVARVASEDRATRATQASAASALAQAAGSRDDLPRRFASPISPLLEAEAARRSSRKGTAATTIPDLAEPDPAVVLLDRRVVRVHPNGLSEVFAQRVLEVRTDSGAEDNKEFLVRYTPGSEEVEILEARIFRRGARGVVDILQAAERDDQDLSEPWYGLYYDYRAEVVRFEGLRAGDVLEVQYLVSDVSRENQLAGYFGDLQFISESIPKRRWDYTLLGPHGRSFHVARPAVAGLEESASDEGDEHVLRFSARDVKRIESEPAMPGIAEVSPYLHISTYASWDEVGTWYWRLVEEQLAPDDTIRRAAQAAVQPAIQPMVKSRTSSALRAKAMTDVEKVRAIHALVVAGTRYVGLEFGIHGFKPYKVSQVLARKFGDCKDKAALLTALLGEVGIEAEMVLLRTRRGGRIAPSPASLAIFDHAIVYVPKLDLYLDGTAEFSGMDELPNQDQGVMVLRVGPHGSRLVETPVSPSARNRASRRWEVKLSRGGDADVNEVLVLGGQAAPEWREHYQTAGERMDRYAKVWTGRNPGARLDTVDMPGIDDRNRPVTVTARATVPHLAETVADGGLLLPLGARDADLVRTYARLSDRRSDLVLAYPWQHDEVITYQLPAGFRVAFIPGARTVATPFGRFELVVERQGPTVITARSHLDVARDRVSPSEYVGFRRFLADVDAAMAERIVLSPAPERPTKTGAVAPAPESPVGP